MDASQTRREFKFLLPPGAQARVLEDISGHLPADRGQDSGYSIVSEYYDSADFKTYWQKRSNHPNRRRIRTRLYQPTEGAETLRSFIEIKHRLINTTVKRRMAVPIADITHDESGRLLPPPRPQSDPGTAALRVHNEIVDLLNEGLNVPAVRTCFHRFAFDNGPTSRIRVTFDDNVQTQLWQTHNWSPQQPLFPSGETIMEVKSIGSVPYWFRSLVAKHQLVPRGVSKYATTLDSVLRHAA
ncbi:MAG: polyphosphate polymerase domain-containing protein [Synoicihabitans sp.]